MPAEIESLDIFGKCFCIKGNPETACYKGIFLLLIYNKEVALVNPEVKMQLQIFDLEDDILIELHLEDEWVKVMWWFCIRCDCQLGAVILRNIAKNFGVVKQILLLFTKVHILLALRAWLAWGCLPQDGRGSMSLHTSGHVGKQIYRTAPCSRILAGCCSVCYQTTKSSLQHLFYTDGRDMGTQWSEMLSVDRTGCQYSVSSVKEHLWSQSACEITTTVCKGPNVADYVLFSSYSFKSASCRIFAPTPSYWCFMLSAFCYLPITTSRSHNQYSIKSRS